MTIFNKKIILLAALSASLLFTTAAKSATYKFNKDASSSFLSGEVTVDGTVWDWTKLVINPISYYQTIYFGTPSSATISDSNTNKLSWSKNGYSPYKYYSTVITGWVVSGGIWLSWDQRTVNLTGSPSTSTQSGSAFFTEVSAVPVPASAFLFAPALLGFIGLRRKNLKTAA